MSYARITDYLSQGGYKVITPFEKYKELKKQCKVSAKIEYICPMGHQLSITYGSLKNKKSKHKNNFEGFCSKCKNGTPGIVPSDCMLEEQNINEEEIHIVLPQVSEPDYECRIESGERLDSDFKEELSDTLIPEKYEDNEGLISLNDYSLRYIDKEPEFIGYYIQRRDDLCRKYKLVGNEVFNISKHVELVKQWLCTNKNIIMGTSVSREIIKENGNILFIPDFNIKVIIQTTLVHNIDTQIHYTLYTSNEKMIIFLLNGEEIADIWYIIKGKRYYSICNKYDFTLDDKIHVHQVRDEDEYFFLEYFLFNHELDLKTDCSK